MTWWDCKDAVSCITLWSTGRFQLGALTCLGFYSAFHAVVRMLCLDSSWLAVESHCCDSTLPQLVRGRLATCQLTGSNSVQRV